LACIQQRHAKTNPVLHGGRSRQIGAPMGWGVIGCDASR
jgi:hypothetical protein